MTALTKALIGVAGAALLGLGALGYAQHGAIPAPEVSFAAQKDAGVPFELFRGNRIFVPATINGHATTVMLDSGASTTTVDRAFAKAIGLPEGMKIRGQGTGGAVDAELVGDIGIDVAGTQFRHMTVGVMDLQPVAQGIGHPITVIIGRELFNSAVVSIDWDGGRLRTSSPSTFTPASGNVAVKLGRAGPFHTMPINVVGTPLDAFLDLGNGGNLIVAKGDWSGIPGIAALPFAEIRGGGVGGLHSMRAVTFPSVTYAGKTFSNVPGALDDISEPGKATHMTNAGIGFLKQFIVDIDFGNDRLFLRPRSNAPLFERDRAGARFDLLGDRLKVAFVSPRGPASNAGLKQGDEIIAVGGRKVTAAYYAGGDWTRAAAGKRVELTRADGTKVTVTLADYY